MVVICRQKHHEEDSSPTDCVEHEYQHFALKTKTLRYLASVDTARSIQL